MHSERIARRSGRGRRRRAAHPVRET
jgi:hypothetical protein